MSANLSPEHNFLFTHSDDPEFLLFNWKVSAVALLMFLIVGIAAVFVARRWREFTIVWWMLLALAAASVFLMFPPSAMLWRYLPKLRFLQFPWRWLGPLGVVFAAFVAAALGRTRKQIVFRVTILATIAILAVAIASNAWWDSADVPQVADDIHDGYGYQGTDEYAPAGSNPYSLPGAISEDADPSEPPTPQVEKLDSSTDKIVAATPAEIRIERWTAERKIFTANIAAPATLAPRLLNYPSWEIRVDDSILKADSNAETAQMLLPLHSGTHRVEISFRRTPDRLLGAALSVLTALALFAFWIVQRRRSYPVPAS